MEGLGATIARVDDFPLLFEKHPQPMWLFDLETLRVLAANEAAQHRYGFDAEEFRRLTLVDLGPPEQAPLLRRYFEKGAPHLLAGESRGRSFQQRGKDGVVFDVELSWNRVDVRGQAIGMAIATDVSTSRGERMVLAQNGLLEMIARGEPLAEILDALVLFAERELPGLLGSVLLLDDEGQHVRHGAGPSLPREYMAAIDGAAIGPRAGSCGTAAYYGVAVIVEDIRTDPRWDGYREYALPHGLVSCWSTPIHAASGQVLGTFALYYREPRRPTAAELGFIDIVTAVARIAIERDRERRILEATTHRQAAVLDALPAHVALVDGQGVILSVNARWSQLTCVPVPGGGQSTGANFLATCAAPEAADGVRAVLAGTLPQFEQEYPCESDGETRWFQMIVQPLGDGDLHGAVVVYIDVTARRLAELGVRESEDRYRHIFENDVTGDVVSRADGTIVEANPAFVRIFRFDSAEEVAGRSDAVLFPEPATRRALLDRVTQERIVASIELELRRKDGSPVHVLANVAGTFGKTGGLERVFWYFIDRTEHKALEEQLRMAQKMEAVGLLAGGVAHDFNNLLTVINSYSDLLLARMGSGGPLTEMVTEIRAAGDRAGELTRQLLAFGRKQVLKPVRLDLNELLSALQTMLRRLIGEDIAVVSDLRSRSPAVHADRSQIEQVVLNLVLNARDAMPTGGRIILTTRDVTVDAAKAAQHPGVKPGSYVAMSVRDTGHGMDAETVRRIFEPFFTTKGSGKGTGLGLATVYGIVRQSGGFVEVESTPGQGAIFTLHLPADLGQNGRRERTPRVAAGARGHETVMLVEDEGAIRSLCRQVLADRGYRVLDAADGEEALAAATAFAGPIHLLVTDVVMPQMSGPALAAHMQAARPGIKVLYVSGYTDDDIVRHGVSEDRVALLSKPFTPSALCERVREVLDRS